MGLDHSDARPQPQSTRIDSAASERPPPAERRVWFPPELEDFETPMEVTAYAGRR